MPDQEERFEQATADAQFIAATRTDVVELLEYVEELERVNGNYRRVIKALPNGKNILKMVDKI